MAQSRLWIATPEWMLYLVGLAPAIYVFGFAFANKLGPDPMQVLENSLGEWGLRFLILGLAITPLARIGRINLIRYRRAIGLIAFIYIVLHLSVYIGLDQQFDWRAIWKDIVKRPYITIGMAAFLCLVPLALTSNKASIRIMGALRWRKLHRLVYLAALLGALHYLILVKAWPMEPFIYLGLIIALLALRIWKVKRAKAATA